MSPTESQGNLRYPLQSSRPRRISWLRPCRHRYCTDGAPGEVYYFKEVGKLAGLRQRPRFSTRKSGSHIRTYGPPSIVNCRPLCSDPTNGFNIVYNGIVTNPAALRLVLQNRNYKFETKLTPRPLPSSRNTYMTFNPTSVSRSPSSSSRFQGARWILRLCLRVKAAPS